MSLDWLIKREESRDNLLEQYGRRLVEKHNKAVPMEVRLGLAQLTRDMEEKLEIYETSGLDLALKYEDTIHVIEVNSKCNIRLPGFEAKLYELAEYAAMSGIDNYLINTRLFDIKGGSDIFVEYHLSPEHSVVRVSSNWYTEGEDTEEDNN